MKTRPRPVGIPIRGARPATASATSTGSVGARREAARPAHPSTTIAPPPPGASVGAGSSWPSGTRGTRRCGLAIPELLSRDSGLGPRPRRPKRRTSRATAGAGGRPTPRHPAPVPQGTEVRVVQHQPGNERLPSPGIPAGRSTTSSIPRARPADGLGWSRARSQA